MHDSKFNEEKLAIQFRSGRLGHFGLAVNWYCNFPYQTWELRPNTKLYATLLRYDFGIASNVIIVFILGVFIDPET